MSRADLSVLSSREEGSLARTWEDTLSSTSSTSVCDVPDVPDVPDKVCAGGGRTSHLPLSGCRAAPCLERGDLLGDLLLRARKPVESHFLAHDLGNQLERGLVAVE
jgi:hypothetical protein